MNKKDKNKKDSFSFNPNKQIYDDNELDQIHKKDNSDERNIDISFSFPMSKKIEKHDKDNSKKSEFILNSQSQTPRTLYNHHNHYKDHNYSQNYPLNHIYSHVNTQNSQKINYYPYNLYNPFNQFNNIQNNLVNNYSNYNNINNIKSKYSPHTSTNHQQSTYIDTQKYSQKETQLYSTQSKNIVLSQCKSQKGCRDFQDIISNSPSYSKESIVPYILSDIVEIITNKFGNFLIQKIILTTDNQTINEIFNSMNVSSNFLFMCTNQYGTRVIQILIQKFHQLHKLNKEKLLSSIQSHMSKLSKDKNGYYIIIKCLEHIKNSDLSFLYKYFSSFFLEIGCSKYGSVVIQKYITLCTDNDYKTKLINKLIRNCNRLIFNKYANFIIVLILYLYDPSYTSIITKSLFENSFFSIFSNKNSIHIINFYISKDSRKEGFIEFLRELIAHKDFEVVFGMKNDEIRKNFIRKEEFFKGKKSEIDNNFNKVEDNEETISNEKLENNDKHKKLDEEENVFKTRIEKCKLYK